MSIEQVLGVILVRGAFAAVVLIPEWWRRRRE
jgi:hypothetical protein